MKLYVNCITSGAGLRRDIKELIPEMNLRRRMSRVVKSGVAAGIESPSSRPRGWGASPTARNSSTR